MPRRSSITPALIAEVSCRRVKGETWKAIAADLRRRGLPYGKQTLLAAGAPVMSPERSSKWRDVPEPLSG